MRIQRQRFTAHLRFAMPEFSFPDRSSDRRAAAIHDGASVTIMACGMGASRRDGRAA
jgi:hypothetical protein